MKPLRKREESLRVEELTTVAALDALRPEWLALYDRASDRTPFQMPEWVLPWWTYFGEGQLLALVLRRGDQLIGIVPLFIRKERQAGERRLLLIGTGNTDYLDALIDDSFEGSAKAACQDAVFAHLLRECSRWDVCDLQQLRRDSALLRAMRHGWSEELFLQEPCPVLSLPSGSARLSEAVPRTMSEKLGYYRRRAERFGAVCCEAADEQCLDECFNALIQLHRSRWSMRGLAGVLQDHPVQEFHREVMRGMLRRAALRCYVLRLDHRIIAIFYGFSDSARGYYYLGGFDPEFHQLSPGTLIVGHAIERAIAEGLREFHATHVGGASDHAGFRTR